MISLKKHLDAAAEWEDSSAAEVSRALAEFSVALLDGLEAHVLDPADPRLAGFGPAFRKLRDNVGTELSPEALKRAGQATLALLDEHRRARAELREQEGVEVRKMIAMFHQTIAVLSGGSERSISRLRQVEEDLKSASAIGDIVALKDRLRDTLRYVQEQSAREREESRRTLAGIELDVQRVQERIAVAQAGVPDRFQAEQALGEVFQGEAGGLLLLVVLERAGSIRDRFGASAAERFVYLFAQDLMEHLPYCKKLYRWTENSLLGELEAVGPLEAARSLLRTSLGGIATERRIDVGQRLAVFSNQHRWTAIQLSDFRESGELAGRLDQLVKA